MNRNRIFLVVADEWFAAKGGLSSFNRTMCVALAAVGVEVHCLVPSFTTSEEKDALDHGVRLVRATGEPGMTDREALACRPRLIADAVPDVVIGHGRVTGPIARALAASISPPPLHLHFVHMEPGQIEFFQLDGRHDAGVRAERLAQVELDLAQDAAIAVPVGPLLADWLRRDLDDGAAVHRFDPGFDRPWHARGPRDGVPQILLMGRMQDIDAKGVDLAARAVGTRTGSAPPTAPGICWCAVPSRAPAPPCMSGSSPGRAARASG